MSSKNVENVKIGVSGNADAGKSTLIGVLKSGKLDDGRGLGRSIVLKNKHEISTGRTSSISFNNVIYQEDEKKKVITMVDLAGHEKYLKTTFFGLTGLFLDCGIVVIGANMGITKMTKEHLGILLYLKIPIIVIITKIDICPDNIYKRTKRVVKKLLNIPIFNKKPFFFSKNEKDAINDFNNFKEMSKKTDIFIPVISISNKTGCNMNIIHNILKDIKPVIHWKEKNVDGSIMYIDSTFNVRGIGIVVSGTLRGDTIKVNQKLWIGPINGNFISIRARSLHNNIRENVNEINDSDVGCIAVKFTTKEILNKSQIIKGAMVFSTDKFKNNVTNIFHAKIKILNHSTTICNNYQPIIHCGPIRQTAKLEIIKIISKNKKNKDKNVLRTGGEALVKFTFMFHPEYIENGNNFFFRDGNTKGHGTIIKVITNNK